MKAEAEACAAQASSQHPYPQVARQPGFKTRCRLFEPKLPNREVLADTAAVWFDVVRAGNPGACKFRINMHAIDASC